VQGTTNVSSTTANNTQAGASNSTVTTDNIQETEIVESQTTTYEEGTDGRYLSWEIANVDTDRIGIASKINAKLDSVEVTKSAKTKTGGNFVTSGDEITYTISVENKEKTNNLTGVEVTDKIPASTTFISAENGTEVKNSNGNVIGVKWSVNLTQENDYKAEVKFTVKVNENASGTIINDEAYANGEKLKDPTKTSIIKNSKTAKVQGRNDGEPARVNDIVTYTITIDNTGDAEGLVYVKDAKLETLINDGILSLEDTDGNGLEGREEAEAIKNGQTIELKANETKTIVFNARIEKISGAIENSVVVKASENDEDPENPENNPSNTIKTADISVNKEVVDRKSDSYKYGEEATYKITVTNNGSITLKNVKVSEKLDGIKLAEGESNIIESLQPEESKTVTFLYTIGENDLGDNGEEGKLVNNVKVTANVENSNELLIGEDEEEILTEAKITEMETKKESTLIKNEANED